MPRSGSFSASLARAQSLLDELGLIENVNAWPDYSVLSASLCRTMTYVDLWRKCVTERLYDFGLINGSLFQFVESPTDSYSFLDAPILPKSFDDFAAEQMGEPWMMENGNDVEMFSMLRDEYESYVDTLDFSKPATPVRYDHSPAQFRPPCHPVAHLHMGFSSEVRIATRRHWTPESFTMFIVRQYFPQAWHNLLERNKETHFPGAVRHNLDEVASMHWPIIQEAEVYLW